MVIQNFIQDLDKGYGGYSKDAIVILGWGFCAGIIVIAMMIQLVKPFKDDAVTR